MLQAAFCLRHMEDVTAKECESCFEHHQNQLQDLYNNHEQCIHHNIITKDQNETPKENSSQEQ